MAGALLIRAGWVIADPVTEIENGWAVIQSGRVSAVGSGAQEPPAHSQTESFPECVLMPGLVNAHSHLELTLFRGVADGLGFADWLAVVKDAVLTGDPERFAEGAAVGVRDCLAGGVTSVADHSTFGLSPRVLSSAGMRSVVFKEVFTPDPDSDGAEERAQLRSDLEAMSRDCGDAVTIGISCHSPYNASKAAAEAMAREFVGFPRSIHVAESPEEMSYVRAGEGVLAERHRMRGFRVTGKRMSPVEYLDNCSYWRRGVQAVHLTQASRGDIEMLRAREVSAAFCPGSNAALGVGIPPIGRAREAGLLCGLGTDSAISLPRLDMFEEMRAAVLTSRLRYDPISARDAFGMATAEGAASLGWADCGKLAPGMRADMVALRLSRPGEKIGVVQRVVWEGSASEVEAVWVGGKKTL